VVVLKLRTVPIGTEAPAGLLLNLRLEGNQEEERKKSNGRGARRTELPVYRGTSHNKTPWERTLQ